MTDEFDIIPIPKDRKNDFKEWGLMTIFLVVEHPWL